jgi:hypothetical protein
MNHLATIGTIAARQHGLIAFDQLLQAGVTPGQLRRLVHNGGLVPLRRRVYRLSGALATWPQTVLAAVLASGAGAMASHFTAGALWDLKPSGRSGGSIHVTAPRQRRLEGVTTHVRTTGPNAIPTRQAIPVTSVERTIFDLASMLDSRSLGLCVDDALRRDLLRLPRLRLLVERSGHHRFIRPLRRVLADRGVGYDAGGSDWERDMDRLWDKLGLPLSVRQHPVTANGHRYILDRAIPELKVGVEWNGFTTHGTRSAFDYDSDRRADLTAAGWHMVDFTSRSDPGRLVAAVRGAIEIRSAIIRGDSALDARI